MPLHKVGSLVITAPHPSFHECRENVVTEHPRRGFAGLPHPKRFAPALLPIAFAQFRSGRLYVNVCRWCRACRTKHVWPVRHECTHDG
jgi:hypothetical protein